MVRSIPIKLLVSIAIAALVAVALVGQLRSNETAIPQNANSQPSAADLAWLKQRLRRPAEPAPKPGQAQVLLIWRAPEDAARVRPVIDLVDHPEGVRGVYGMDVADSDALAMKLNVESLRQSLPTGGAWLIALDRDSRKLGATPLITPATVQESFELAEGQKVTLDGSDDPYLNKPAPDFTIPVQGGGTFHLAAQKGHKILFTFYCGCDYCKAMARELAVIQRNPEFKDVKVYGITHMTPFAVQNFKNLTGQPFIALDENHESTAMLYNSVTCPRVWYVGPDGKVKYYSRLREDPAVVGKALMDTLKTS
ncbi:MAG TPA: redoxin domain-containing protein [Armatimonadota bacterium]|nr:redoxin domain-containing protein [Armatimonadota bacterium]